MTRLYSMFIIIYRKVNIKYFENNNNNIIINISKIGVLYTT